MYFTVTVNEKLADMLRTATELKVQIESFQNLECKTKDFDFHLKTVQQMNNSISSMLNNIGDIIGFSIATQAFKEAEGGREKINGCKCTLVSYKDAKSEMLP